PGHAAWLASLALRQNGTTWPQRAGTWDVTGAVATGTYAQGRIDGATLGGWTVEGVRWLAGFSPGATGALQPNGAVLLGHGMEASAAPDGRILATCGAAPAAQCQVRLAPGVRVANRTATAWTLVAAG